LNHGEEVYAVNGEPVTGKTYQEVIGLIRGEVGTTVKLGLRGPRGERTISLRRGDKTVLQPNMTFHFMPALWLDDGGLEITESVVITDSGYQSLANVEQRLLVK